MFDPIRPYLPLVYLGLGIGLFVGGCVHGTGKGQAKADVLQARVDSLNGSLSEFVRVFDDVNAAAKLNAEAAKVQATLATQAVERAEGWAGEYRQRLSEVEGEIDAAKRDPGCRRLLESTSCAVLR